MGRFVMFLVCIFGIFNVSMMVVSFTNELIISQYESKAFIVLERMNMRKKLKSDAANIITKIAKMSLLK